MCVPIKVAIVHIQLKNTNIINGKFFPEKFI